MSYIIHYNKNKLLFRKLSLLSYAFLFIFLGNVFIYPSGSISGPLNKLFKISISNPKDIDLLKDMGLKPITIEENYVVARISEEEKSQISKAGFSFYPIVEKDLVQRLVKINFQTRDEVQSIANLGIDIWEVQKDYVLGRAFDNQIQELRKMGLLVEILKRDTRSP